MLKQVQHDISTFYDFKQKTAFTLAEVLITLVIIGVIAAITVPTLIAKYQDQQLTSQFKKGFSTMTNAINKTNLINFSGQAECYYGEDGLEMLRNECNNFFYTLSKNLKTIKICNGNAKENNCVPTYANYRVEGDGCGGFSKYSINNINTVYVLSDGQIIIRYEYNMPLFLIDINGFKGPNKAGYDLFNFNIYKSKSKGMYLAPGGCLYRERNGRTTEEMMKHAFAGK